MIDVTHIDLHALVKEAYRLSVPQGLGFLHYQAGGLTDDEVTEVITRTSSPGIAVSMDYVKGRAVKLTVFKDGDKRTINDSWYDHSEDQLHELLASGQSHSAPIGEA